MAPLEQLAHTTENVSSSSPPLAQEVSLANPAPINTTLRPMMTAAQKKEWWQKSLVRRTASFVQADLEAVTSKSPFLQQPVQNEAAYFHRSEIITADVPLGHGGFSIVYEILGFRLSEQVSCQLTAEQNDLRLHYVKIAVDTDTGRGRFVLKHLQERLLHVKSDFSFAAADMALEVAYLERLKHDHIVSLRGLPVDGLQALEDGKHDGYFLILDRLQDTLDQRIQEWKQFEQEDSYSADNILRDKIEYARQLASACSYLHQHDIVFRDLKPQNIGFSQDGRIQLFDFGLCRELPKYEKDDGGHDDEADGMYEMSGVGTRRYMAPEIVNNSRYNCKADVYSWSMVVWQMFALSKPYPHYSTEDHRIFVCQQGERPPLEGDHVYIPWVLRSLLQESWCECVTDRFTMKQICDQLVSILAETDIPIIPRFAFEPEEYLTITTITSEGIEVSPRKPHDNSCISASNFGLLCRLTSMITCPAGTSPYLLSSSPDVSKKQQQWRDPSLDVLAIKPPGLAITSSDESTCCVLSDDDDDDDDDDSSSQLVQMALSLAHSVTM